MRGRRSLAALLAAAMAAVAPIAHAQGPTGIPTVDSAGAARAAWSRAARAIQRGDTSTARHEVSLAADAFPAQPSYLWARAALASQSRDSATTLRALREYAALGLGRDLAADSNFLWLAGVPAFGAVRDAHSKNSRPLVRSRAIATLPDSTFWPEGMDVDPRTGRYYIASIRHRTIAELRPDGTVRELLPRDAPNNGPFMGVRVDTARGVLWATTSPVPQAPGSLPSDSTRVFLLRIKMADGTIERRWALPPTPSSHALGDLVIGPHGDVFVTDSYDPVLYRLRPGADSLESVRSPLFRSLQGLAPTPDGRTVFLADYSHGLLRVDLATGAVAKVADAPNSTSVGCDGIAWDRGSIIAVQNGVSPARVVRFALDASGKRIERADVLDRNSDIADEPTIGAILGRQFVYVANSQWEKYDQSGRRVTSRKLTAPILLAVPLP